MMYGLAFLRDNKLAIVRDLQRQGLRVAVVGPVIHEASAMLVVMKTVCPIERPLTGSA